MSLRVHYEILNQKGTPAFFSDTYANRPAFGFAGRVFISTDTGQIFEDTGSAWSLIADAGVGGGTLASVCANGNTTSTGIVITAGNLGINTSSPGAPLDIHGTGTNAQFNGTGTNNAYLQFQNAGTSKWRIGNTYNAGANSFGIYNNGLATNALSFNSTTNEAIFSGSVGIGSGTNPVYPLDVVGNTRVTGQLNAFASGSGNGLYVQGISNYAAARIIGDSTTGLSFGLSIQAGTNSSDYPLAITNYATSSTLLKVTGAGNVGINNSTPSLLFSVVSTDNTQNSMASFAANNLTQQVELWYGGVKMGGTAAAADLNLANKGAANMLFSTNSTEKMRITSAGNVLINTTTLTGAGIGVSGTLQVNNEIFSGGTLGGFFWANRTTTPTSTTNWYGLYTTGGTIYFYSAGNGNVSSINATTGIYTPLSDINKKKDFELSNIGLNSILSLKPTLYRMKSEENTEKHLGFIAQEVKQFIPQAYVQNNDFIGLDYNPIVATLVKAVQELNEKLERNNIN
jgi:hypothetical protein